MRFILPFTITFLNIKKDQIPGPFEFKKTDLAKWFNGIFDNFNQVQNERYFDDKFKHVYVTANFSTHPTDPNGLIASYYYGKNASNVFRFRYYTFDQVSVKDLPHEKYLNKLFILPSKSLQMKLFRPTYTALQKLITYNYNTSQYFPDKFEWEYLNGCDIIWNYDKITNQYHGKLIYDTCSICSQLNPNVKLTIKDDLKVWYNEIWVNDRVYNQKGDLIIGNIRGIPYKFQRVHDASPSYKNQKQITKQMRL